ncbi:surface lipoprotein assembly modifier [Sulfitobacter sp. BSw21498]|uniref:surface lipoprotein assembly modifier n=1 Tax=Sulfitobacter sp. BSw21498 TaxID=664426 RepID=UPI00148609E6|nr:surface lipoprotein assembly modifier [Sulfitobacter sp. BSw21498]
MVRTATVAVLWACATGGAGAEITLSPDQLRNAAIRSVETGATQQGLRFADALLQRDAGDFKAQVVRARALRDLGRTDDAIAAGRKAWRMSDSDSERYASAMIMAQSLSSAGHKTRAQFWLRRAAQHAPGPRARKQVEQHYNYVRQTNALHTQLSFTLAPNSNINNGSARDTSELNYVVSEILFGTPVEYVLSGSAQALSGIEYGFGLNTRYRFHQTSTSAHDLTLGLSYRTFSLSDGAKADAPMVDGGDFAFGTVMLGYGFRQINLDARGEFQSSAQLGQSWYGGAEYASRLRAGVSQSYQIAPRQKAMLSLAHEIQDGQRTVDQETTSISGSFTQNLNSGDLAYLALGASVATSPDVNSEYDEVEVRGAYVFREPVAGAALQLGMGVEVRDYDVSRHSADGRQDKRIFADITATFQQFDYYGFNPSATLQASRTDSNINLYDINRVGISIGIKSAF